MASTAGARGLAAWAVRTRTWAGNISPGAHHATRAAAAHATKHAATPRGGGHGHGQDTWDHTTTRASHTHAQVPGQHQCALPGPFAVKGLGVGARRGMAALPEVDVELPPSCTRIGSIEGPYEPPSSEDKKFFAVVEVGAQQFKVTADDLIFTEKLKVSGLTFHFRGASLLTFTPASGRGRERQSEAGPRLACGIEGRNRHWAALHPHGDGHCCSRGTI
mmetsp:Transcript_14311/g.36201  ORF Transcript_14311/g.36201 Transcript_14311/m.36201 type:complete len:219 (+) Transcript_14311:85-741(+)